MQTTETARTNPLTAAREAEARLIARMNEMAAELAKVGTSELTQALQRVESEARLARARLDGAEATMTAALARLTADLTDTAATIEADLAVAATVEMPPAPTCETPATPFRWGRFGLNGTPEPEPVEQPTNGQRPRLTICTVCNEAILDGVCGCNQPVEATEEDAGYVQGMIDHETIVNCNPEAKQMLGNAAADKDARDAAEMAAEKAPRKRKRGKKS